MTNYGKPNAGEMANEIANVCLTHLDCLPSHIVDHVVELIVVGLGKEDRALLANYCNDLGILL